MCCISGSYSLKRIIPFFYTDFFVLRRTIAGWASASSSWRLQYPGSANPYAIASLSIEGYISENNAFDSTEWIYNSPSVASISDEHNKVNSTGATGHKEHDNKRRIRARRQLITTSLSSMRNSTYPSAIPENYGLYSQHNLFSRPEDHPCITEQYQQVCQARTATHIHVNGNRHSTLNTTHNKQHRARQRRLRSVNTHQNNVNTKNNNNNKEKESTPIYTAGSTGITNPRLWSIQREWLPQFEGTNGPVFSLTEGRDHLKGNILIAGAFYNYPALVVYNVNTMTSGSGANSKGTSGTSMNNQLYTSGDSSNSLVGNIPGSYALTGLITSVVQAYLPVETEDALIPEIPPHHVIPTYDTFFVVFGCVGVGIALGLIFALGCCTKGFHVPYYNYFFRIGNNNLENGQDSPNRGMSLLMLSGGEHTANALQEFRLCFDRAMSARHLPTHETLLIINPKEIVLSKIIGK